MTFGSCSVLHLKFQLVEIRGKMSSNWSENTSYKCEAVLRQHAYVACFLRGFFSPFLCPLTLLLRGKNVHLRGYGVQSNVLRNLHNKKVILYR